MHIYDSLFSFILQLLLYIYQFFYKPFYILLSISNLFFSMENKLRNHSQINSLAMHKDSHTISKIKPKIRIIHIFAPEIITTDAENFRELVQKLTGKPNEDKKCFTKKTTKVFNEGIREEKECYSRSNTSSRSGLSCEEFPRIKKEVNIDENEIIFGLDVINKDRVVKEEIICDGGYLGGFSDLEGFISEINGGLIFPLDETHNYMQGFEPYHQLL